jgi:hypothetical protein
MARWIYQGEGGWNPDLGMLVPGQALDDETISAETIAEFQAGGLLAPEPKAPLKDAATPATPKAAAPASRTAQAVQTGKP